jgi:hypothetical protein
MRFIEKLWAYTNDHFQEIAHLAKIDEKGNLLGIWRTMSDESVIIALHKRNTIISSIKFKGLHNIRMEVLEKIIVTIQV